MATIEQLKTKYAGGKSIKNSLSEKVLSRKTWSLSQKNLSLSKLYNTRTKGFGYYRQPKQPISFSHDALREFDKIPLLLTTSFFTTFVA